MNFEVRLFSSAGMWTAVCHNLDIVAFGQSKEEALRELRRAMQSSLAAAARGLKENPDYFGRLTSVTEAESVTA